MSDSTQITGSIVNLTAPEDEGSTIWSVEQVLLPDDLPQEDDEENHHIIDFTYGPCTFRGYVDSDTFDASFIGIIAGTYIGLFSGNLKDGFGVNVNLFVVKGEFNFYLKNGSDVWIHQDYAITFGGRYEGDYKITHL